MLPFYHIDEISNFQGIGHCTNKYIKCGTTDELDLRPVTLFATIYTKKVGQEIRLACPRSKKMRPESSRAKKWNTVCRETSKHSPVRDIIPYAMNI